MTVFEGRPIGLLIELNYDFDVVVTTFHNLWINYMILLYTIKHSHPYEFQSLTYLVKFIENLVLIVYWKII